MNFGFLTFPGLEELDLVGPWEMVGMWRRYFDGPKRCLLISQDGGQLECAKGMRIQADVSFDGAPQLDVLLIPGGLGTRTAVDNSSLVDFVSRQARGCRYIVSVCTGSFILHRAGVLSGRRATTHYKSLDRLRALGDVEVVEERIVRDGNVWTSAGVSAGIDLALALIAEIAGEETAGKVQLSAEYYPSDRRYGTAHEEEAAPAYLAMRPYS